jgi:hypothetical protein
VLATTDADVARQIAEDPDTAPDLTEEPLPPDPYMSSYTCDL